MCARQSLVHMNLCYDQFHPWVPFTLQVAWFLPVA